MIDLSTTPLAFIALGLLVGVASGLIGIGGAVLLIPSLVFLFGFTQAKAQGTTLGAMVPPIGIFAAIQYYRNGLLDIRAAALIAAGFVFGALGGATLVPFVPQTWLKRGFATILAYLAVQIMLSGDRPRAGSALPGAVAALALWGLYFVKKALGKRPPPPPPRRPPPPDTEYFI